LPVSLPVWNLAPKLHFLQFPWRWLVVLEAPLGIFVASAVWTTARRWRTVVLAACGIGCAGLAVVAGRTFFQVCDDQDAVAPMVRAWRDGDGFQGTDEYAPRGADNSIVAENLPGGCLVDNPGKELGVTTADDQQPQWAADQKSCSATFEFDAVHGNAEHWIATGSAPRAGYYVLRLRCFFAWDVRVNGRPVGVPVLRDDGLMTIWIPAGSFTITADWRVTSDVQLGRFISIVSLLLVTALGALALRRKRSQLK
jgi:hypothetical protein